MILRCICLLYTSKKARQIAETRLNNKIASERNATGAALSLDDLARQIEEMCIRDRIEDIRQLNAQLHREYPSLKIYMFGHSMGSLAVRAYLKRYDDTIDALIVCGSPSKNPAAGAGKLLCKLMKCMKGAHYRSPLIQKMAFGNHCDGFAEEGSDNVWLCSDMELSLIHISQKRGAVYYSCDTGRLHTDDASYRTKDDCGRLSA